MFWSKTADSCDDDDDDDQQQQQQQHRRRQRIAKIVERRLKISTMLVFSRDKTRLGKWYTIFSTIVVLEMMGKFRASLIFVYLLKDDILLIKSISSFNSVSKVNKSIWKRSLLLKVNKCWTKLKIWTFEIWCRKPQYVDCVPTKQSPQQLLFYLKLNNFKIRFKIVER